jgi:hypothetical protein
VDIKNRIELDFCRFLKAGMQRIACIVHEVVKAFPSPTLQCLADFSDESVKRSNVTSVEAKSRRFPPQGFDLADKTLGVLLIRAIGEEDIDATPRKVDGRVAAQALLSRPAQESLEPGANRRARTGAADYRSVNKMSSDPWRAAQLT